MAKSVAASVAATAVMATVVRPPNAVPRQVHVSSVVRIAESTIRTSQSRIETRRMIVNTAIPGRLQLAGVSTTIESSAEHSFRSVAPVFVASQSIAAEMTASATCADVKSKMIDTNRAMKTRITNVSIVIG
jgi:hypothetical protein